MSLYEKYVLERTNNQIHEIKEGFIVYSISNGKVFIEDLYIDTDFRRKGMGTTLTDIVAAKAKTDGCTELFCGVCPQAKQATESMKAILAYGFKVESASNSLIIFRKDI
jgi:ribosomal protein S18 acetylase RimI-like enzyme